jgi:hypothetical protein
MQVRLKQSNGFNINRKGLLNAATYWVNYQRLLKRQNLFWENYITNPIGDYLIARFGNAVRREQPLKCLGKGKSGRIKRIDYCCMDNNAPKIAIEAKFINNGEVKTYLKKIKHDIDRLVKVKIKYARCICIFILFINSSEKKNKFFKLNRDISIGHKKRKVKIGELYQHLNSIPIRITLKQRLLKAVYVYGWEITKS